MSEHMQVAQTIKEQLYVGGLMKVGSWGTHQFIALTPTKHYTGGLRFKVSGRLFRGLVQVLLMPNDTYTVELIQRRTYEVKERREDIYCDMLTEVIDRLVETK